MFACDPDKEADMIAGRYRGHIFDAVARAVVTGERLHVRETATRIADATGSFPFLEAITDALIQEGLRRQAILVVSGEPRAASSKPN
jgi:hypothetical protein